MQLSTVSQHEGTCYYGDQIKEMRGNVACMGDTTNVYRVLVGKLEGDHLEDLGTDGTVISKLIHYRLL